MEPVDVKTFMENATQKKCDIELVDLEPVDVKTFMEHGSSNEGLYKYVWLIYHAASSFERSGLLVNCTPCYPEPEYYTLQDKDKFEKIVEYLEDIWTMYGGEDRDPYFISHMMKGVELLAGLLVPPVEIPNNQRLEEMMRGWLIGSPPTCHPLDAE